MPSIPTAISPTSGAVENGLWTRRSALALTAGFLALGVTPARAAFVQHTAPLANNIVVSKSNRVLALMSGTETLKSTRFTSASRPRATSSVRATDALRRGATTSTGATRGATSTSASASATPTRSTSPGRGRWACGRAATSSSTAGRAARRPPQGGLDRRLHRCQRRRDRGDLVDGADRDPDHHPRLSGPDGRATPTPRAARPTRSCRCRPGYQPMPRPRALGSRITAAGILEIRASSSAPIRSESEPSDRFSPTSSPVVAGAERALARAGEVRAEVPGALLHRHVAGMGLGGGVELGRELHRLQPGLGPHRVHRVEMAQPDRIGVGLR